ncbi:MAG TPA: hypothetical protein VNK05_03525, partial [Chloroflexota bacterium]|nr:hypothetical protein [Chloroflexota bacterium]
TGVVPAVADEDGLNLATCIEVARRLLIALPAEEDAPLGAPGTPRRRGGERTPFRLRGFRFDELAPQRRRELQERLAGVRIHRLPRRVRGAVRRAALEKTRLELQRADDDLLKGLASGADTALARDFDPRDRDLLQRNLGASPVGTLYGGEKGLDLFDRIGADLSVGDLAPLLTGLWDAGPPGEAGEAGPRTLPVAAVLSKEAQAAYPADFVTRRDVTPFTTFLVLPGEADGPAARFLPLTADFAADYERELLRPRLASGQAESLLFDEGTWASAGAFAAVAPYVYATQVPLGLRQAYGKTGQMALARRFGGQRVSSYRSDGTPLRSLMTASPSSMAFDPDLLACVTDFEPVSGAVYELGVYAETWIALADYEYRQDRRTTARSYYADVRCAIEQVYPAFADEARLGLTGVYNTIRAVNDRTLVGLPADRNLARLSTLNVQYTTTDGLTHRVMGDTFLVVRRNGRDGTDPLLTAAQTMSQYFEWNGVRDIVSGETKTGQEIVEDLVDEELNGDPAETGTGDTEIYVNSGPIVVGPEALGEAELYTLYLACEARIAAIDAGLNWYGYTDGFVPPWAFEHLYGVARDLCNRALEAEQRVFALLQLYEAAAAQEFLAAQNAELAGAQAAVAEAQVVQQVASNAVAMAQAELSQQQAAAQAKKSGVWANVAIVTSAVVAAAGAAALTVATGGTALPAVLATAPAVAGGAGGLIGNVSGHSQDVAVLNEAIDVTNATLFASVAGLGVAIATRDAAALQAEQAGAYVDFLLTQDLNSDGYLFLMGLAKQTLEGYLHHANRMAWLAERALEHETRQAYDLVRLDYTTRNELTDMTRAQQVTGSLETLRSEYVAGQTSRLQEIKWTVALSQIDPIAWQSLRETGTGTFVLRQRVLDMHFPGTWQHRLKDVRVEIVGLVPPDGARGLLSSPGVSWVRVPNEQSFLAGETKADWVTTSLAASPASPQYDQYVSKRVLTNVVTLALSQFDVRGDRAVLSAPQGMLKPVEHQGLDAAWTLTLHRQSNNFDFLSIVDAELTFWFLCAYDPGLEQAQEDALSAEGLQGKLTGAATTAFATHQPDAWSRFVGAPADAEALDLRYLTADVGELPLWEAERRLTNIMVGCARDPAQEREISLRLCCQYDPVGYLLTTKLGTVYSLLGIDTSGEEPPPEPDPDFEAWVRRTFYFQLPDIDLPDGLPGPLDGGLPSGGPAGPDLPDGGPRPFVPFRDPAVRWVIKAAPAQAGRGWHQEDEDGGIVSTSSGPLQGAAGGSATYRDGARWKDYSFRVKVAHRGGTLRLRLRDDGADHYALQISPEDLRLFRVEGGVEQQLGDRLPFAYPAGEFLAVDVRVVGDRLSVAIDGITLAEDVDGDPAPGGLQRGTVSLQVLATDGDSAVDLDDVQVVRLTGKGAVAETLLDEPFTASLPADWAFVDGDRPWAIAPRGHRLLDLSPLLSLVLQLDYRYQMELEA